MAVSLDQDGYVYVDGRKKNIFITSFGRNISPEWPEMEICCSSMIAQAAVFGESRPENCAVIVVTEESIEDSMLQSSINAINERLPDYARIHHWIRAKEPFSVSNGMLTDNGRIIRQAIYACYQRQIDSFYIKEESTENYYEIL